MLTSIMRMVSARRIGFAGRAAFLKIAQAGFVAMMAVGDEHRLRPQRPGDGADDLLVSDRPELADDAEVVGRLQGKRPNDSGLKLVHDAVVGSG